MYFSRYNIISKIRDSENYFILNLLSGNADILEPEKAKEIVSGIYTDLIEMTDRGYLANEADERKLYKEKYLNFLDNRNADEAQLFFVPNYSCNFSCSYCYQDQYLNEKHPLTTEIIHAFFNYVDIEFAGRKKYVTIFGGEPLLPGEVQEKNIKTLLSEAKKRNIDIAVVTNGYTLVEYIDILKTANIREVQVTLDGTAATHDTRRFLKNKAVTFDKIVEGIDACLVNNFSVNLRFVADKQNINGLPDLADFAIKKGWTKSPLFKTQIGRNYELHHCQESNDRLFTRVSLYEEIYKLVKTNPQILEFHKPAFSISKFIFEQEEMPGPLFDSCPACKTEWAFDYTGKIYSCTATVGKPGEELGTFYPVKTKNEALVTEWEDRDITTIPECKECSVQFACGGGCGSVAKNQTGHIHSPDCRPVKELLELGFGLYFPSSQ